MVFAICNVAVIRKGQTSFWKYIASLYRSLTVAALIITQPQGQMRLAEPLARNGNWSLLQRHRRDAAVTRRRGHLSYVALGA
jgi:hypothetical protein